MDTLKALEDWYAKRCNGEWEHQNGVTIETLDNPGWKIRIDIGMTELASSSFGKVEVIDKANGIWFECSIADSVFEGFGSPNSLGLLLRQFLDWATSV